MFSFDARVHTINISKHRQHFLDMRAKELSNEFCWMFYNKNLPSYCLPSGEKRVCSRKQKLGPLAPLDIDACASSNLSLKKTATATVTKLFATCAVNIYYQINAKHKKRYIILVFHVFLRVMGSVCSEIVEIIVIKLMMKNNNELTPLYRDRCDD